MRNYCVLMCARLVNTRYVNNANKYCMLVASAFLQLEHFVAIPAVIYYVGELPNQQDCAIRARNRVAGF